MPVFSNIGGTWRTVTQQQVRIGGVWRKSQPSCNISGVWRNSQTEINADNVVHVEFCLNYSQFGTGTSLQSLTLNHSSNMIIASTNGPVQQSYDIHTSIGRGILILQDSNGIRYIMVGEDSPYSDGVYYSDLNAYGTTNIAKNSSIYISSLCSSNYGGYTSRTAAGVNGIFGLGQFSYYSGGQYSELKANAHFSVTSQTQYGTHEVSNTMATYTINSVTNQRTSVNIPFSLNSVVKLNNRE